MSISYDIYYPTMGDQMYTEPFTARLEAVLTNPVLSGGIYVRNQEDHDFWTALFLVLGYTVDLNLLPAPKNTLYIVLKR